MNKIIKFGEDVEGYNIPVLNEREIRASAGIIFLIMLISLDFVSIKIAMKKSVKEAVGTTVQSLIKNGIKTSYSEKEPNELSVEIPDVEIDAKDIQIIRRKILNVRLRLK